MHISILLLIWLVLLLGGWLLTQQDETEYGLYSIIALSESNVATFKEASWKWGVSSSDGSCLCRAGEGVMNPSPLDEWIWLVGEVLGFDWIPLHSSGGDVKLPLSIAGLPLFNNKIPLCEGGGGHRYNTSRKAGVGSGWGAIFWRLISKNACVLKMWNAHLLSPLLQILRDNWHFLSTFPNLSS